jgi:DNA-binding transcriptional LysR family regulator
MAPEPDLTLLRTFLTAHRTRSMTRTAAELGLSQPGVTAQIHKLEKRLQTALFRRSNRGLQPTGAADELAAGIAPHLDGLVHALDLTVRALGTARDPFRRTVLLGSPAELTALRILPALGDLYRSGLRLRVSTGLAEDLLHDLTAGALDLVVSTVRPRARSLTVTPLADEEFVLVASPELADRLDRAAITNNPGLALARAPVVSYDQDLPILRRYWRHVFGRPPPVTAPAVLVTDLRAVAAACVAGAGYSALPRYLVRDQLADRRLVALLQPEDPPINTFYLAWRTSATPDPAVVAAREHLVARARSW